MKKKIVIMLLMSFMILQACSNDDKSPKEASTTEEQSVAVKIESASIEVINDNTIKVVVEAVGEKLEYAYYIYKNGEILEKINYGEFTSELNYEVEEEGLYKVSVFVKNATGEKITGYTKVVEI